MRCLQGAHNDDGATVTHIKMDRVFTLRAPVLQEHGALQGCPQWGKWHPKGTVTITTDERQ
jgi:hypothetical protein